jgi:hypothetical protein
MTSAGADAATSEFTRILGRVSMPDPSATRAASPPAVSSPEPAVSSADAEARDRKKSMVPLIVALNVVALLTIAIVAYFVLRK